LGRFPEQHILVVGDVMLDEYIWGEAERISPEAPVIVVNVQRRTYVPGGAGNVVNNVRALGAKASIIGVVGQDEAGQKLRASLERNGVDGIRLILDPTRPTTVKTRVMAHHQQVVRIDEESRAPVGETVAGELGAALTELMPQVDGVIVSDYAKGVLVPEVVATVLGEAAAYGRLVAVNPKPNHCTLFSGVDLLSLNEVEAETFARQEIEDEDTAEAVGQNILRELGVKGLLLTRGAKGSIIFNPGEPPHHIPVVPVEVYDVAGAGDTTISVALLALLCGANYVEAATLASYAAAAVVRKVGVATVTWEEIQELITGTGEDSKNIGGTGKTH